MAALARNAYYFYYIINLFVHTRASSVLMRISFTKYAA